VLAERILASFCKDPKEVPYEDALNTAIMAARQAPPEPLANLEREFPDLAAFVRAKDVLDFGCGYGDEASEMARKYGARVTGLDTHLGKLAAARGRTGTAMPDRRVRQSHRLDAGAVLGQFFLLNVPKAGASSVPSPLIFKGISPSPGKCMITWSPLTS